MCSREERSVYGRRAWKCLAAIPAIPIVCAYVHRYGDDWLSAAITTDAAAHPLTPVTLCGLLSGVVLFLAAVINGICSVPSNDDAKK